MDLSSIENNIDFAVIRNPMKIPLKDVEVAKISFKDLGNISLVYAILVIAQMCGVEFSANHFHFIDFTPNLS